MIHLHASKEHGIMYVYHHNIHVPLRSREVLIVRQRHNGKDYIDVQCNLCNDTGNVVITGCHWLKYMKALYGF